MTFRAPKILGGLLGMAALSAAVSQEAGQGPSLAFVPSEDGGFAFDTGILRGRLRPGGKSRGLCSVIHVPTGAALDRGDSGYGLFSHYRVFSAGKRYGGGAWDWASEARRFEDGSVQVRWPAGGDRPFEMAATWRWADPRTLDLDTEVRAQADLPRFEVFLASYFTGAFCRSFACVRELREGRPGFLAAEKEAGTWQMFPRDDGAAAIAGDGRWKLPPHPVSWTIRPALAYPLAVRRDPRTGLAVALMGLPSDCFAVSMPHQEEAHFSVYLSLFGRDLREGESARARTRLMAGTDLGDDALVEAYRAFSESPAGPAPR